MKCKNDSKQWLHFTIMESDVAVEKRVEISCPFGLTPTEATHDFGKALEKMWRTKENQLKYQHLQF